MWRRGTRGRTLQVLVVLTSQANGEDGSLRSIPSQHAPTYRYLLRHANSRAVWFCLVQFQTDACMHGVSQALWSQPGRKPRAHCCRSDPQSSLRAWSLQHRSRWRRSRRRLQMRVFTQRKPAPVKVKARASRDADAELDHLAHVISYLAAEEINPSIHGMNQAYWRKRIEWVDTSFELIPIQKSRVDMLRRLLDQSQWIPDLLKHAG